MPGTLLLQTRAADVVAEAFGPVGLDGERSLRLRRVPQLMR
jgi:hypothetical protein